MHHTWRDKACRMVTRIGNYDMQHRAYLSAPPTSCGSPPVLARSSTLFVDLKDPGLCRISCVNFGESPSLLKKSLSGRSEDQNRIQHLETKAKTLQKWGVKPLNGAQRGAWRSFSTG